MVGIVVCESVVPLLFIQIFTLLISELLSHHPWEAKEKLVNFPVVVGFSLLMMFLEQCLPFVDFFSFLH